MSTKDAQMLRAIAENVPEGYDVEVLQRIAAQLDSDAKRYADSEKLQAIGKSAFESIAEMVAALECDYDRLEDLRDMDTAEFEADTDAQAEAKELREAAGDCTDREDAERRIMEDPLSIELTGTWVIGETPLADKAIILLGTGGPAVRIVCELDEHAEPSRAFLQVQDWFLPWTDYIESGVMDTLLTYCRCFYFREG